MDLYKIYRYGFARMRSFLYYAVSAIGAKDHNALRPPGNANLVCYYELTVVVENVDDEPPVFSPVGKNYSYTISEAAHGGTSVGSVTVNDTDLGPFGIVDIYVDKNNKLARKYFEIGPVRHAGIENTADILVAGGLDVEADAVIKFNVFAKDTVHIRNQTVAIHIINVNDNRPVFVPDFYNWEVSATAETGKSIITVTAVDADIGEFIIIVYRHYNSWNDKKDRFAKIVSRNE